MDNKTTIEECKQLVKTYCEERDWTQFHTPKEMAIAIITESSELLDLFRFHSDQEIESMLQGNRRIEVEEEVSDIFQNLLRFCDITGIDLSNALDAKMVKNRKKYPIEKCKGKNKKYTEYEE